MTAGLYSVLWLDLILTRSTHTSLRLSCFYRNDCCYIKTLWMKPVCSWWSSIACDHSPFSHLQQCQHNTAGPRCERCNIGFYGDPVTGGIHACRPCPCFEPASESRWVWCVHVVVKNNSKSEIRLPETSCAYNFSLPQRENLLLHGPRRQPYLQLSSRLYRKALWEVRFSFPVLN